MFPTLTTKSVNISVTIVCAIVLWASCSKIRNTEYPEIATVSDTITGLLKYSKSVTSETPVINWPFGIADIEVYAGDDVENYLTHAEVSATGNFTLVLPASVKGSYLSSLQGQAERLGGTTLSTPQTLRVLPGLRFKVNYVKDGTTQSIFVNPFKLSSDSKVDKAYYYYFFDGEGQFTGNDTLNNEYYWSFVKGWQIIENQKIENQTGVFSSTTIDAVPENVVWVNL
jgi:hypothetical protein